MAYCFIDDSVESLDEVVIPVESRSVMYGDGCFDTLRCDYGKVLGLGAHLKRFQEAAQWLGLDFPSHSELMKRICTLLKKNELLETEAMVRMQIWRKGGRGYIPRTSSSHCIIVTKPLPTFDESVRLGTVNVRRIPSTSVPSQFKLSNAINYIAATREAVEMGYDDAVMLTTEDYISETPIANLCWIKDRILFTPSANCDLLPGTTRWFIMRHVAPRLNYKVEKVEVKKSELIQPDFVFTVNSLREITAVKEWDEWTWEESIIQMHLKRWREGFNQCKWEQQQSLNCQD